MPQTVHAWLESEDRSGAAMGIAAIADDLIETSDDNLKLRPDMPLVALAYVISSDATYKPTIFTISSPSIASNPINLTKGIGLNFAPGLIYDFRDSPIFLGRPGDLIGATGYEVDEAGVAHYLGCALIVAEGNIPKERRPQLTHIHRCTSPAVAVAATWEQGALTEVNALPAGQYEMYGARVESATAMAARFVFKGMEPRPAVIPVNDADTPLHPFSDYWGGGVRFRIPGGLPDIEMLTMTAETPGDVELYLRRTGD